MANPNSKVAIVTGANKGIGLAIVQHLAEQFDGIVYLTARNEKLGLEALQKLTESPNGLTNVRFRQLDVTDQQSVDKLVDYVRTTYGGLDILVNNASILYNEDAPGELQLNTSKSDLTPGEKVKNVISCNYTGTVNMCNSFGALLRDHARVVNVTSDWGLLRYIDSAHFQEKLGIKNASIADITALMQEYVNSAQDPSYPHFGYESYKMSKNAVNAYTRELQKQYDASTDKKGVIVSSMNPGDVKTDMNNFGMITPDEASETAVYLALLPPNADVPRGCFWYEKATYDWADVNIDIKIFDKFARYC